MAIIKSNNAETLLKSAIVLDLGDVAHQAQRLREAAQAQAKALVQEAQNKVESMRKAAHDESAKQGYDEGLQRGLEEGRKQGQQEGHQEALKRSGEQLSRLQGAWSKLLEQWESQRQTLEQQARQAVLDLAIEVAQKVVHRVIEVDDRVVASQLSGVLSYILRPMDVTVRVCAEDRPVLEEAMPGMLKAFAQVQSVQLIDDPQVGRGGCVISYGQGVIDATVEKQIERLVEMIVPAKSSAARTASPPVEPPAEPEKPSDEDNPTGDDAGRAS